MPYVNLGILAHVDAGKTSLTERLALTRGEGVLEYAFDRSNRSVARSRPGHAPITTPSTGRNTCCTSCGGSK